jgi:putative tryptophan/tyrosine transport system substrate-binding protein
MTTHIQRRQFISLVGSIAAAWPLNARAQQPAMPMIGFLDAIGGSDRIAAFRLGLRETGYIEGQNVAIEYRGAEGQYDRLPTLANDLVRRQVGVIVAVGNVAARATKSVTETIPIVFVTGDDPVAVGLVSRLNRPEGNITGLSFNAGTLPTKRLELVHELVPSSTITSIIINPTNANAEPDSVAVQEAARALGLQIQVLRAGSEKEIDAAFASVVEQGSDSLLVNPDSFFATRRNQFVSLAARFGIPSIYYLRDFVTAGGLMSYAANVADAYRHVGMYAGKILKGAKPADLPIMQPTKFEFVINLKTAKTLGLVVPASILIRADEMIE